MTGRELIVYILENNLENEDILNPNEKLNTHIFIREDVAAAECNVGIASIKAWCKQKYLDYVTYCGCIYIVKNKNDKAITYFEYDKMEGYDLTPKKGMKIEDAINVNKVVIINPSLAEKVAKKKFDLKFRKLLTLLNVIFESDDDTGTAYQEGLNEVSKLRIELINKYRKHLEKEEADLMNKKLDILEQELKLRLYYLEQNYQENYQNENEIGRSR